MESEAPYAVIRLGRLPTWTTCELLRLGWQEVQDNTFRSKVPLLWVAPPMPVKMWQLVQFKGDVVAIACDGVAGGNPWQLAQLPIEKDDVGFE